MVTKKILASGIVAAALLGASFVSAQTYYPSYGGTSCVNLTTDLSYGSRGSNVTQLQQFLVSRNFPGGGSWMVTGFYGQATVAAVRNFQQSQGLPMTGSVDAATRAAISRVSCNGILGINNNVNTNYNYNFNQGYPYTNYNSYPYTNPYLYNNYNQYGTCGTFPYYTSCQNTYGTAPHLTSLSVTSALPGSSVTVYGTGFDPVNNTVYVGGTTLTNVPSQNTTSLTFTMPANATGVVSIYVGNSHGTSNSLTVSTGYNYPYNYPQNNPFPCGYYYGYNCQPNTGTPVISYLSPISGGVGTSVTVYGSGFSTTGNNV